jgi:hypothetical protein
VVFLNPRANAELVTFFYITYKFSTYLTGNTIHLHYVARNSDHETTEAVYFLLHNTYKFSSYLTGNTVHLLCEPGTLTTRPQRRSTFFYITYKFSSYLTGNTIHLRSVGRNYDPRPQRRSTFFYITYINSVRTSQEAQYISVL